MDFESAIRAEINRHSKENGSNTPDFILANYLGRCLKNLDATVMKRSNWYDRHDVPGKGSVAPLQFEVGKYYCHATAGAMHIVGSCLTSVHGWTLIGENTEGKLAPVGQHPDHATGWREITQEEWVSCFPK